MMGKQRMSLSLAFSDGRVTGGGRAAAQHRNKNTRTASPTCASQTALRRRKPTALPWVPTAARWAFRISASQW
jgi:hypothetical protein